MAQIRPFAAVRYASGPDISSLIAPPYDVLDERGKKLLMKRSQYNIVEVDLPHLPAKTVGPDAAYAGAARTVGQWLVAGVLKKDPRQGLYAYTQSYQHGTRTFHRRGFFGLVKLSPFGQGEVFPHEKTYPEAIVDRLKLTTATRMQLSPIFGLFNDARNEVTNRLYKNLGRPEVTATLDGVQNDLWSVNDSDTINAVTDLMSRGPIFIADGHHRYTMALQYQKDEATRQGGKLAPNHPANWVMFAMVAMQDDGLLILPTHRVLGGLGAFDAGRLRTALGANGELTETNVTPQEIGHWSDSVLAKKPAHTFGLYDGRAKKLYELRITNADVLQTLEPGQSPAWRSLDVAILQRYLLQEVIGPTFAPAGQVTRSYTADANTVADMTDGVKNQIAIIIKPTPLHALEELGKFNEVMPQKSTYFYPKLATGMVMNSLET